MTLDELKTNIRDIVENEDIEDVVCDSLHVLDHGVNAQDFFDSIRDRIQEQEIVYHSRAMNYLMDNDASLQYSLGLAHEYGYTCDRLNSELLATILYQDNLNDSLNNLERDITNEIDTYLDELVYEE